MSEKSSNQGVLFLKEVNGKWVWFKDGDEKTDLKYEGEISNEVPNGQGTLTYPDGEKYVGEYKDGKENGQGTFTFPDGDKYVGEFKDGNWNGQGTLTFPDGGKYVGEFKDGDWDGQGTFTFPNGNKGIGEFKENKPLNITQYDKYGNITGRYVNGVEQ